MKLFRIISLVLALLVCLGVVCACNSDTEESSQTEDTSAESQDPTPTDPYKDADGNYVATTSGNTYGGRTITFLTCGVNATHNSEILYNDYTQPDAASDQLPEVINKAYQERADYVEALLDCKIEEIYVYDSSRYGGKMAEKIRSDNLAFTAEYEIVSVCLYDGASLAQEGQFVNLYEIDGLDMNAPWWDETFNKECEIGGQLYFTIGDIGTLNKSATACLTFNKTLYTEYKLDEKYGGTPYDLVRSGKWTLDIVLQMAQEFSQDLDGNGTIDYNDVYGWGGQLDDMWSLFYGSGSKIASAQDTADGYPELTMYTERSATIMEKMQTLVQDKEHYVSGNDYFGVVAWPMVLLTQNFIAGNSLFYSGSMEFPMELGDMEDEFGLVPTPKGDENQDTYYSLVNPWTTSCFAIPISLSSSDYQMIGDFLNVMGAASSNLVSPAFLNQCLEYMKVRDDDTVDMIENYILPGRGCDIGMFYAWGRLDQLLQNMASQSIGTFASNYESLQASAQAALEETVNFYKALAE